MNLGFELEADEILPNLWQGSFPNLLSASEAGFEVVVLCAREMLGGHEERNEYKMHGMTVVEAPFDDTKWPTPEELSTARWAASKVTSAVLEGKKVLVTCQAGLNRSGLVNGIALRDIKKITGIESVMIIKGRRENALFNNTFAQHIYNLGKS